MDIINFYKCNSIPIEKWNFDLLSSKEIDKLIYQSVSGYGLQQKITIKNIANFAKLTDSQIKFVSSLELYADVNVFSQLMGNKNLPNKHFERLCKNNINYLIKNFVRIAFNNKKRKFLIDLMLTAVVPETNTYLCFQNIFHNKLDLEDCRKMLNVFNIDSINYKILFAELLKNPHISNKIKKTLMFDYDKKEIFK